MEEVVKAKDFICTLFTVPLCQPSEVTADWRDRRCLMKVWIENFNMHRWSQIWDDAKEGNIMSILWLVQSVHLQSCKKTRQTHAIHSPGGLIMKTFFCLLSLDLNFPMGKKENYEWGTRKGEKNNRENKTAHRHLFPSGLFHFSCCTVYSTRRTGKAIPLQTWTAPWGFRKFRLPEFLENRHMKVVRLSTLRTGRLYLPGDTRGIHFC